MNRAIHLAIGSALALTLLILVSFVSAFFRLHHAPVAAVLFVLSMALLGAALLYLAREAQQALNQFRWPTSFLSQRAHPTSAAFERSRAAGTTRPLMNRRSLSVWKQSWVLIHDRLAALPRWLFPPAFPLRFPSPR